MKIKIKPFQTTVFILALLIIVGTGIILLRTYSPSNRVLVSPEIPEKSKPSKVKIAPPSPTVKSPKVRKIGPSIPEELGVPIYYENDKPKTQEEWNAFIAEAYQKNRRKFEEDHTRKLGNPYRQLEEANLEEMKKTAARLDEKIAECEEKLKDNPEDEDFKKQLENLQRLKALTIAVYGEKLSAEE